MKNEEKKTTTIVLNGGDAAIVIREEGKCEIALPNRNKEKDEVSGVELLTAGIGMFLKDPKFVEMVKTEFIKNIQQQGDLNAEDTPK